jgi:hypothetical protein
MKHSSRNSNLLDPFEKVAVSVIKSQFSEIAVAFSVDLATETISGIGVHEDADLAQTYAVLDTVRDNGWANAFGRPAAIAPHDCRPGTAIKVAAEVCGSSFQRATDDETGLVQSLTNSLQRYLQYKVPAQRHTVQGLYCETANWAIELAEHFERNPTVPLWTEETRQAIGQPLKVTNAQLPLFTFEDLLPCGQIECGGELYQHPWLEMFRQQGLPRCLAVLVCRFPDSDSSLWVVDRGGCFAVSRVDELAAMSAFVAVRLAEHPHHCAAATNPA